MERGARYDGLLWSIGLSQACLGSYNFTPGETMTDIILYQYAGDIGVESASPFCVKVHRLLAFKGLDYETKNVGSPGEMKKINPGILKVPVLSYDGQLVADSSRIATFLEDKHPEPSFFPKGGISQALCHLFEDWADEALYWYAVYRRWVVDSNFKPFAQRTFGTLPPPLRWFLPKIIRKQVLKQLHGQGLGRVDEKRVLVQFEEHLDMLEGFLGKHPFLTGDKLSVADISVFAPLRAVSVESMPQTAALVWKRDLIIDWLGKVDRATTSQHTVPFETPESA